MMDRVLKAVYLGGIVVEILVRGPHERQRRKLHMRDERVTPMERGALGLLFVGTFLIPTMYIATSWLDRANYRWSNVTKARAGSLGTVLFSAALWLFWRSHVDLGQNWSPSLQINDRHKLVSGGVYRRIRHPMYASHWLWSIGQGLLLHNWIAGPASFVCFLPLYLLRVPREERMMLDHFSGTYRDYMARTGRVLPRVQRVDRAT